MTTTKQLLHSVAKGLVISAVSVGAHAIECATPPSTALRDYRGEFDISAARVRGISGPSASLAVQSQAKNLLDKIPNADKALVELTYLYTLCTALRDDHAMTEREKATRISEYSRALQGKQRVEGKAQAEEKRQISGTSQHKKNQAVGPTPRHQAAAFDSKPEESSPEKKEPVKTSTVIQGNSGPVINNSNVKGDLIISAPK